MLSVGALILVTDQITNVFKNGFERLRPCHNLEVQDVMRKQVTDMALELGVVGLMNTQFAVKDGKVYLIEVNPRAARTVPFVSKATGVPLAKIAARVMAGQSLISQNFTKEVIPPYFL